MALMADVLPDLYKNFDPTRPNLRDIPQIIANVIQIALVLSSVLAVIFIMYSGIQYIVSQGDPGRVGDAKSGLRNAVIGLILSGGAFLLVQFFAGQLR